MFKVLSNEGIDKLAIKLVNKHMPLILKDLGLDTHDGIDKRIFVHRGYYHKQGVNGYCYTDLGGVLGAGGVILNPHYIPGSAYIVLYPLEMLHYTRADRQRVEDTSHVRRFTRAFKRKLIFTLAHELEHYRQHYSGDYYQYEVIWDFGLLSPYRNRQCEDLANEYAEKYIKSLKGWY
ncbi:hypothetical protein_gp128 [Bacillus phage vB_BceM_WH1]|nr:hypothetical protein_gp128 [Bacillus phage vB_BceM_WH1]